MWCARRGRRKCNASSGNDDDDDDEDDVGNDHGHNQNNHSTPAGMLFLSSTGKKI